MFSKKKKKIVQHQNLGTKLIEKQKKKGEAGRGGGG